MNPLKIFTIWSYKKELRLVIATFLISLSAPVIAIFILVNAGIDVVSDHLANINPQTHQTQILNPADGSVTTTINNPVQWPMHGVVTLEFGQSDWPYQPFHTGLI